MRALTPNWLVFLFVVGSLMLGSVFSVYKEAGRLYWVINFLGFVLYLYALLYIRNLRYSPRFIRILIIFLIVALISTILQFNLALEVLAGIKRYFTPYGLLFLISLYPFTMRNIRNCRKVLLLIAAVQLPFALYQFFVLVPLRGGLQAGSEVTDVVAGTFGMNLVGGSPNSVMAVYLLIVFSFLVAWWKMRQLRLRWLMIALPFLFLPIALGEVKIVFIMLPIIFLVIFKDELARRPFLFLGGMILGGIVFMFLGYALVEYIMHKSVMDIIENTIAYNVGGGGDYVQGPLNRVTVLRFWWEKQGLHDPIGLLFGYGLGSSHMAPNAVVAGHMALRWPTYGIGLTTASKLLWDVGVVGFMLYVMSLIMSWFTAGQIRKHSTRKSVVADATALQAAIVLLLIMIVYNDYLVLILPMQVIYALILGYLAYLYRNEVIRLAKSKKN